MEVERIWRPQESGTWLCLLKQHSRSSPMKAVGGNVPGQQQVLSALKTDNYLPVQAERGIKRKPGWMATEQRMTGRFNTREAQLLLNPRRIRVTDGANTFRIPGSVFPKSLIWKSLSTDAAPQPHFLSSHERNWQPR